MYKTQHILPKLLGLFVLMGLLLISTSSSYATPMLPGVVRVVKLVGLVSATNKTNDIIQELNTGDRISENYLVEVGPESSVVLLFSNGATLSLKENTKLSIDEFLQEPYQFSQANLAEVSREPSSSKTRLYVNYGKVRGSVKQLNSRNGSRYDIGSPIGIAGIRGTTFELIISESGSEYTGSFSIGEGSAFFISKNNNYLPLESESEVEVSLTDAGEIIAAGAIDPTTFNDLSDTTSEAINSFNDFSDLDFDPTSLDPTVSETSGASIGDSIDGSGSDDPGSGDSSSDDGSGSDTSETDTGTNTGSGGSSDGDSGDAGDTSDAGDTAPPTQAEEDPDTLPSTPASTQIP